MILTSDLLVNPNPECSFNLDNIGLPGLSLIIENKIYIETLDNRKYFIYTDLVEDIVLKDEDTSIKLNKEQVEIINRIIHDYSPLRIRDSFHRQTS